MTKDELEGSIKTVIEAVESLPAPAPDAKMLQAAAVIAIALIGEAFIDLKRIADAMERSAHIGEARDAGS